MKSAETGCEIIIPASFLCKLVCVSNFDVIYRIDFVLYKKPIESF